MPFLTKRNPNLQRTGAWKMQAALAAIMFVLAVSSALDGDWFLAVPAFVFSVVATMMASLSRPDPVVEPDDDGDDEDEFA